MKPDLYNSNYHIELKGAITYYEKYGLKIKWKKTDNKIIDVGTAEGTVITSLKKYFPPDVTILGCDMDERMIELANEHHRDERTSFMVLNIENDLPENMKGNYSHVFSFYCFNWVKDQVSAFNNIYNLLEPDGECFKLIVGYSPIFEVYRRLTRSDKWNTWVYDVERYTSPYCDSKEPEKEVEILMRNAGFDNITIEYNHLFYTYDDMDAVRGSLMALLPFKIPSEKMDEFWEDYVQELRPLLGCGNATKNIKYDFKILTVHAHKPKDAAKS